MAADLSDTTGVTGGLAIPAAPTTAPASAPAIPESPAPTLRSGAWALEFEYEPELFRGEVRAATISAKRHFTRGTALRAGAVVSYVEEESERRSDTPGPATSGGITTSRTEDDAVSFFVHLVRYARIGGRFAAFIEAGPFIQFSDDRLYDRDTAANGDITEYDHDTRGTSWGIQAGPGFEWFFSRRVSLGARWGVSVSYGNGSDRYSGWGLSASGVYTQDRKIRSDSRTVDGSTTPSVVILTAYL